MLCNQGSILGLIPLILSPKSCLERERGERKGEKEGKRERGGGFLWFSLLTLKTEESQRIEENEREKRKDGREAERDQRDFLLEREREKGKFVHKDFCFVTKAKFIGLPLKTIILMKKSLFFSSLKTL